MSKKGNELPHSENWLSHRDEKLADINNVLKVTYAWKHKIIFY